MFVQRATSRLTIGLHQQCSCYSSVISTPVKVKPSANDKLTSTAPIILNNIAYPRDDWTNVTPKVLSNHGRNLHLEKYHPLSLIRQQIVDFMYSHFPRQGMSPLFSVFDRLSPIVSVEQNFDSILVKPNHPSRSKSDCYYLTKEHLLRSHTSAHQAELIRMGLTNFLVVGDVYRRDEIDSTHYPVFHQVEACRLCNHHQVFKAESASKDLTLFETKITERTNEKQESHTRDAVYMMSLELKSCLLRLTQHLLGKDVEMRWVDTYFPFTHPSWELEVKLEDGSWLEMLGCGIMEQTLLRNAGAGDKIGWAFGLGLERLAMRLYKIPDIRLFWSTDSGVLHQFHVEDPYTPITYKAVSTYPQCTNDISFWLPMETSFTSNDFYDLVRTIGGDLVEQVSLIDEFYHPKTNLRSHCYRIVYRDMTRTLLQAQVNEIHNQIEEIVVAQFGVKIR